MSARAAIARIWSRFTPSMQTRCCGGLVLPAVGPSCAVVTFFGWAVAVLLAGRLSAAAQDFQVRNWHVANGLPDGTVTSLAQTPDGCLWVGTRKGLARFDGDSFTRVETAGDTALKDSSIVGLLTDRQGWLWIASESGLITQFAEGEFRTRYLPEVAVPAEGTPAAQPPTVQAWRTLNSIFALDGAGAESTRQRARSDRLDRLIDRTPDCMQ